MLKASDLRPGKVIYFENALYTVKEASHVAKGNKRSYIQLKLKHFQTGQIIDYRSRVDEAFETPFVQTKEYEYLYREGTDFVLADVETYDQIPVSSELVGEAVRFMTENIRVTCDLVDGKIVNISSNSGFGIACWDETAYAVSKAGVIQLTKSAALFQETGNRWQAATPNRGLGLVAMHFQHDYRSARQYFEQ
jgi:translation elongation factor P/translation initiation factor 5A